MLIQVRHLSQQKLRETVLFKIWRFCDGKSVAVNSVRTTSDRYEQRTAVHAIVTRISSRPVDPTAAGRAHTRAGRSGSAWWYSSGAAQPGYVSPPLRVPALSLSDRPRISEATNLHPSVYMFMLMCTERDFMAIPLGLLYHRLILDSSEIGEKSSTEII